MCGWKRIVTFTFKWETGVTRKQLIAAAIRVARLPNRCMPQSVVIHAVYVYWYSILGLSTTFAIHSFYQYYFALPPTSPDAIVLYIGAKQISKPVAKGIVRGITCTDASPFFFVCGSYIAANVQCNSWYIFITEKRRYYCWRLYPQPRLKRTNTSPSFH